MQVFGTPVPVIPLNEAADAANLSEDDLLAALSGNGNAPVTVSSIKRGITAADLDEVVPGASALATIRQAPAMGVEGQDCAAWGTGFIPVLAIGGTPVLTGQINVAYAGFTATATGGDQPYAYSLVGTWPTGIVVSASTGAVSGTPTQSGTFPGLSVRATDDVGSTADLTSFQLVISP